jgi:hypothetical protein
MAWLYVPASEGSSSPSISSPTTIGLWDTSSAKHTQRPLSWRGWLTRPWVKLLSGTTLPPSTADRGVELWIASLRATPANRSAPQESAVVRTMSAISGRISNGLLSRYLPNSSFSKMLLDMSPSGLTLFEPSYEQWATALRQVSLARRKLARRTNDSGYSSWLTPTTTDEFGTRKPDGKRSTGLNSQASLPSTWSTPNVADSQGVSGGPNRESSLRNDTKGWSTPQASDADRAPQSPETLQARKDRSGAGIRNLVHDTGTWMTPKVERGGWQRDGATGEKRDTLIGQAVSWPTPANRDAKGANSQLHVTQTGTGKKHMDQLPNFVDHSRSFRPDRTNSPSGHVCSGKCRRLNPLFVEWLMSWPIGWTDCAGPVTVFTPYLLQWRFFLFGSSWKA